MRYSPPIPTTSHGWKRTPVSARSTINAALVCCRPVPPPKPRRRPWKAAVAAARDEDEPDPPAPPEPQHAYLFDEVRASDFEVQRHRESRLRMLAGIADDVLPLLRTRLAEHVAAGTGHVEALDGLAHQTREVLAAVQELVRADEMKDPNRLRPQGPSSRLPTNLSIAEFIDAVRGRDLLDALTPLLPGRVTEAVFASRGR